MRKVPQFQGVFIFAGWDSASRCSKRLARVAGSGFAFRYAFDTNKCCSNIWQDTMLEAPARSSLFQGSNPRLNARGPRGCALRDLGSIGFSGRSETRASGSDLDSCSLKQEANMITTMNKKSETSKRKLNQMCTHLFIYAAVHVCQCQYMLRRPRGSLHS